ncbi:hypothetical protein AYI68_g2645 [Smittium mucronatum]|uniref:Carbohydrate-binding module family 19 domain-containing protein n=1 Tax=Smittium mucronatum TaxID=133383 RepID=A0A1R0H268_9FUNG|nr:hypothetical protein AYI68_g5968 [Smittium mucronatum]OLY83218.1 hypothetical protein AYI68_g2645 [Smittium mucronatum]
MNALLKIFVAVSTVSMSVLSSGAERNHGWGYYDSKPVHPSPIEYGKFDSGHHRQNYWKEEGEPSYKKQAESMYKDKKPYGDDKKYTGSGYGEIKNPFKEKRGLYKRSGDYKNNSRVGSATVKPNSVAKSGSRSVDKRYTVNTGNYRYRAGYNLGYYGTNYVAQDWAINPVLGGYCGNTWYACDAGNRGRYMQCLHGKFVARNCGSGTFCKATSPYTVICGF